MSIKIEMLRCFRTVADHGSLAEAATALGRTPSAVSMMLKQFEDHIGAPLFETACWPAPSGRPRFWSIAPEIQFY